MQNNMEKSKEDLLEVAIPTYNGSKTIAQALESIYGFLQCESVRVTVYVNASTDDTYDVVAGFMLKHPMLAFCRANQNEGFDGNIRRCVLGAKAAYVWIFSDDDIAPSENFEKISGLLQEHAPSILYFNHYPFYRNDAEDRGVYKFNKTNMIYRNGIEFFYDCDLGFVSSLVFKVSLAQKYEQFMIGSGGQAHLEASSRISLNERQVFILFGEHAVGARTLLLPRYNGVRDGFIAKAKFFERLKNEEVFDAVLYVRFIRQLIGPYFIYTVLKDRAYNITSKAELLLTLNNFREIGRLAGAFFLIAQLSAKLPSWIAMGMIKAYYGVRAARISLSQ